MSKNKPLPENQIALYQTADGSINIEVLYAHENIWLPQKRMAKLFDCTADNISLHLKNIYKEKNLVGAATTEKLSVVQKEGMREVARTVSCDAGSISHEVAPALALKEYDAFRIQQDRVFESDFDGYVKGLLEAGKGER
ncbi:MAG: hypothetical protein ACM3UZ_08100 [Acidobacteriota bacterium]